MRKDVAGYDLKRLLVGSEGTLGIVTAAWLRLMPAPEAALPVVGFYPDAAGRCDRDRGGAGERTGRAALEYLDGRVLRARAAAFPGALPDGTGFAVIAEADGSASEAAGSAAELVAVARRRSARRDAPAEASEIAELWRWRDGVSLAVTPSAAARSARTSSFRSTGSVRHSPGRPWPLRGDEIRACWEASVVPHAGRRPGGGRPALFLVVARHRAGSNTRTEARVRQHRPDADPAATATTCGRGRRRACGHRGRSRQRGRGAGGSLIDRPRRATLEPVGRRRGLTRPGRLR